MQPLEPLHTNEHIFFGYDYNSDYIDIEARRMCYCVDSSRLAASLLERTMVAPVFFARRRLFGLLSPLMMLECAHCCWCDFLGSHTLILWFYARRKYFVGCLWWWRRRLVSIFVQMDHAWNGKRRDKEWMAEKKPIQLTMNCMVARDRRNCEKGKYENNFHLYEHTYSLHFGRIFSILLI